MGRNQRQILNTVGQLAPINGLNPMQRTRRYVFRYLLLDVTWNVQRGTKRNHGPNPTFRGGREIDAKNGQTPVSVKRNAVTGSDP